MKFNFKNYIKVYLFFGEYINVLFIDPCSLVQDAASTPRAKLAELLQLVQPLQENAHLFNDEEFAVKLKDVQDKACKLLGVALTAIREFLSCS